MTALRIVIAQLNPIVGDLSYNLDKHLAAIEAAVTQHQAHLIVFPELSLTGYPPEDLLLRPAFLTEVATYLETLARKMPPSIHIMIGHPHAEEGKTYNACSVYADGKLIVRYFKQKLPNYGVFDEKRYFTPGQSSCFFTVSNRKIAVLICEDLWAQEPLAQVALEKAALVIVPNASPFETDKQARRLQLLKSHVNTHHIPLIYCNLVGGQDELIFDGGSMMIDQSGEITHCAGFFNETLLPIVLDKKDTITHQNKAALSADATIYQALVLSLHDYVTKNRFAGVLIGLSGGIDSALTLALAVDALGADRVRTVMMPSRYTSDMSLEDATIMAKTLGVSLVNLSIEPAYDALLSTLTPHLNHTHLTVTEENIQARCRAILLMALSNQSNYLVLTTGNRSELAVGYCTLYGDMAGGFAVLKDVLKTQVYQLSAYRNTLSPIIPERILTRAPSAELAPDQKDEDSLAPYPILDDILIRYLNQGQSKEEIIAAGFDAALVDKIVTLIIKSEYKRRQSAIGPHINHQSFGKDWRYPVTDGYRG